MDAPNNLGFDRAVVDLTGEVIRQETQLQVEVTLSSSPDSNDKARGNQTGPITLLS